MYFTGVDGYQNILVFTPMLSSLLLDSNKIVINWISTGTSFRFDTSLEPTMSNLANI